MSRQALTVEDTAIEAITRMAEGNPGAARILMDLARAPGGFGLVLALDDMNMRGSQVWVAYKDHCGCDAGKLRSELEARSPAMVARVNLECAMYGEVAVEFGGSRRR